MSKSQVLIKDFYTLFYLEHCFYCSSQGFSGFIFVFDVESFQLGRPLPQLASQAGSPVSQSASQSHSKISSLLARQSVHCYRCIA